MAPPAQATVRALGLDFPNRVGLAAGFDRDGSRVDEMLGWGFGCVELGTVTPQPVPEHNPGVAVLAANLARMRDRPIGARPVIGVNLGMQPGSPPQLAWLDYAAGMRALWSSADYVVLNFTSIAAQQLRAIPLRPSLLALLARAQEERERLAAATARRVPLLIKWPVYPDCADSIQIARGIRALGYEGLVAAFETQTHDASAWEAWVPDACRRLAQTLGPHTTLVAGGGVDCKRHAMDLRRAGAALVQIYRGFVAQGPALVAAVAGAMAAAGCAEGSEAARP